MNYLLLLETVVIMAGMIGFFVLIWRLEVLPMRRRYDELVRQMAERVGFYLPPTQAVAPPKKEESKEEKDTTWNYGF